MIVATCDQMKTLDRITIEQCHVPGLILMEHAALEVVRIIETMKRPEAIHVVCGTGNNGGDGFAISRLLHLKGYKVKVIVVGDLVKQSSDAKGMFQAVLGLNMSIVYMTKDIPIQLALADGRDLIIDALFGISCTRPLEGIYHQTVEWMNQSRASVVSVDVPSGINGDTGQRMGLAVEAKATVTFTAPKIGLTIGEGKLATGSLYVCDIGVPQSVIESLTYDYELLDEKVLSYLPKRPDYGHKMTFGRVLVIAGSESMSGAGILAAKSAYRSGAGLVEVVTHMNGITAMQNHVPEAIIHGYDSQENGEQVFQRICGRIHTFDGILIGPGLSKEPFPRMMLRKVLEIGKCPLVIDADGLNMLPDMLELLDSYKEAVILTPHVGEMSRLTGHETKEILMDPLAFAEAYSKAHGVITVLKSETTVIAEGSGRYCINGMGNSGMATAGSGDVLAGTILSMIGQRVAPFTAAALGVGLHSMAGDLMAGKVGQRGLTAGDIIAGYEELLKGC